MASLVDIEEIAVDATIAYMREQLQAAIDSMNDGRLSHDRIQMPKDIYDDVLEPSEFPMVPAACVWVEKSVDIIKDRAMRMNVCELHVMFVWTGKTKFGYRYAGALTSIVLRDPTFKQRVARANVTERQFFHPVMRGQTAARAAEAVIEIQQEVQRT